MGSRHASAELFRYCEENETGDDAELACIVHRRVHSLFDLVLALAKLDSPAYSRTQIKTDVALPLDDRRWHPHLAARYMVYRNDHDAALGRFEAELERERLRAANEEPPQPRGRLGDNAVLVFVLASPLLAAVAFAIAYLIYYEAAPPQFVLDRVPPAVDRTLIRACAERLPPNPLRGSTDIERLRRDSAPCRDELHTMATVRYESQAERSALWTWVEREAELAMAIHRLEEKRGRDDAASWRDYDDAYAQRNAAAADWLQRFGQSGVVEMR